MFKNILSATDLVETRDAPVTAAFEIAALNNSRLHILHVLESASASNRQRVKHFKSGQELESNPLYEKQV
jgi:nucleotide-binding universal stress UspA family protein